MQYSAVGLEFQEQLAEIEIVDCSESYGVCLVQGAFIGFAWPRRVLLRLVNESCLWETTHHAFDSALQFVPFSKHELLTIHAADSGVTFA